MPQPIEAHPLTLTVHNDTQQVPSGITGESWSTRSRSLLLDDKVPDSDGGRQDM